MSRHNPVLIVHGGAWAIPEVLAVASVDGVKRAARAGYEVLRQGGTAVDAVVVAVSILEDDPAFDAGTGSVLNAAGEVEMDAVVMDGETLRAGAVACVQNILHPVQLARLVMDKTKHFLDVKGADSGRVFSLRMAADDIDVHTEHVLRVGKEMGIQTVTMETLVTESAREEWKRFMQYRDTVQGLFANRDLQKGCDTVGAVALDQTGNVAFATSTGGITAKRPGRVGDSPIVGAGGYADSKVGAVSTTGHGEAIIRTGLAHRITYLMEAGHNPEEASKAALDHMTQRVQGSGGAVVLSSSGDTAACFTTERMAWAWVKDGEVHFGLDPGQHEKEVL